MSNMCGLAMLSCLLLALPVRARDGEKIELDKLPPNVTDRVKSNFKDAELLHARKEVENGKECYTVSFMYHGEIHEYYISPDGAAITLKQNFSFTSWLPQSMESLLFLLLCVLAGACARWLAQTTKGDKLSLLSEWLSAWVGAMMLIGVVFYVISNVRHKDGLIIGLFCIVWGAVAASIVEVIGLIVQSVRGYRAVCRRWILVFCFATFMFLSLSIPLDMLRVERENQDFKALALRPPAN
jgi:hypothetical protein